MKKAILFIKKIKKVEFFYKKVLTLKKRYDTIYVVQELEQKGGENMRDEDIVFDFNKVRGKIKEVFGTQTLFANAMGINDATLSNKLNNNVEFSSKEIVKACNLLNIKDEEIKEYFFTLCVQKAEQNYNERGE